jgi:uncharacterized protein YyaL (SSP411 family)
MSPARPPGNDLHGASSPYLRQHASNPVHWQNWSPGTFALAAAAGKPVLLSIGYSACHWCHVMARESFADPATAAVMNDLFVCIKVDREERPDLDRLFLGALARLGRQAGWPLTAFLTPQAELFWGGGYFPPVPSFGLPAFTDVLADASRRFLAGGARPAHRPDAARGDAASISTRLLDRLANDLAGSIDWLYGGFGLNPPKFLHAGGHELLLRAWARTKQPGLLDAAVGSLTAMCHGAIYDHVGGGFHRYAVDDRWRVPHFEKMLCDNALMLSLLVKAWQATGATIFADHSAQTIGWLVREMRLPDGAFASSQSAGAAEGDGAAADEGLPYTWDAGELRQALGSRHELFATVYGTSDEGPFAPRSVLFRQAEASASSPALQDLLERLRRARRRRAVPGRDDKVLADWNGLAITALAEAGLAFARADWIAAARTAFDAVLRRLATGSALVHSAFGDRFGPPGFLEDYACMSQAALALYELSGDQHDWHWAQRWVDTLDDAFWDVGGGYAMARDDGVPGASRQVLIDETAAPSGNGTMLGVLPRLAQLSGDERHRRRAEAIVQRFADRLSRASIAGATALNNSTAIASLVQVVLVGNPKEPATEALRHEVTSRLVPDRLLILADGHRELGAGHPAFGKASVGGRPTAFVCIGPVCLPPITAPLELARALAAPVGAESSPVS